MKNLQILFAVLLTLLLIGSGCSVQVSNIDSPKNQYTVYFTDTNGALFIYETTQIKGQNDGVLFTDKNGKEIYLMGNIRIESKEDEDR